MGLWTCILSRPRGETNSVSDTCTPPIPACPAERTAGETEMMDIISHPTPRTRRHFSDYKRGFLQVGSNSRVTLYGLHLLHHRLHEAGTHSYILKPSLYPPKSLGREGRASTYDLQEQIHTLPATYISSNSVSCHAWPGNAQVPLVPSLKAPKSDSR